MTRFKILFCASECTPYAKTGGLADVMGALPEALHELGCDVRVFLPLYRSTHGSVPWLSPLGKEFRLTVGVHDYSLHFWETVSPSGVPTYFLEKDEFFDRSHLYGSPVRGDYQDNPERFSTYCRSIPSLCSQLGWHPDILHLHDWQAALASAHWQFRWRYDPHWAGTGILFTIHNLAYQGLFPAGTFGLTGLPSPAYSIQGLEYHGQCSFLKAGLVYSDFITTVSPRYSQEIQDPHFGCGMDGILREHRDRLTGILNGIDYRTWDPQHDPLLPASYHVGDLTGKRRCKEALVAALALPPESVDRPMLGMIGRLAVQKGFDMVLEILEQLMDMPLSLVILGTGEAEIQERLQSAAERHPDRLRVLFEFDEARAHHIEAGADIFLMPSLYEPCGLNQMYSLRYGTIPVVHATGGLMDSVRDILRHPDSGTGFLFYSYNPLDFLVAVRSSLDCFQRQDRWHSIQQRAMEQDFSWNRSAREYLRLYESVLERKTRWRMGTALGAPV